jgi:N-acetylglutamate synthase-like GNAT family acetyltransferase
LIFKKYEPGEKIAWLKFLANVQTFSDAWEALYIEKPDFHSDCDYILLKDDHIIGVIAGHKIPTQQEEQSVYSIEVLASHPDLLNNGIARTMIAELSKLLPEKSIMTFWTRTPEAKSWYEHCGFNIIDERSQLFTSPQHKQLLNLVKKTPEGEEANLWCFACPCPIN